MADFFDNFNGWKAGFLLAVILILVGLFRPDTAQWALDGITNLAGMILAALPDLGG